MESSPTIWMLLLLATVVGIVIGRWSTRRQEVRPSPPAPTKAIPDPPVTEPAPAVQAPPVGPEACDDRRLAHALTDLRLGVVVYDSDREEVYRNRMAERFAAGRHGYALVEAALERVVDGAHAGLNLKENVDLFGPPALNFVVQAGPFYSNGEPGVVAVIEDVTESRHLDQVRSDFVANVSHELRTPVGAMSVLADILVESDDPEVRSRMAARIQAESQRLGDTLNDLLTLSRIESGPKIEPETVDLLSVVAMAIDRTAETAAQHEVRVESENRAGGPVLIDGDPSQLASAVVNLIDNGVKYSDPGATVEVVVDVEPVGEGPGTGPALLTVSDHGIGIPQRDLNRVFERFYRVDSARSRQTGGTGLGLSIVRHAVRNHGGSIEVESTEGVGSTFTIELPVSPSQLQTGALFADEIDSGESPAGANPGGRGRPSDPNPPGG